MASLRDAESNSVLGTNHCQIQGTLSGLGDIRLPHPPLLAPLQSPGDWSQLSFGYRHLTWNKWQSKHHVDHHLGRLVQREYMVAVRGKSIDRERVVTYTPDRWLAGQLPSKSNICGRKWNTTRFFNDAANADLSDEPFFAVLGPHRSGTSCVAMVMHHLGVHMGNQLGGYEGTGGGEATGLATLCEEAMKFPLVDPLWSDEVLTQRLRGWCVQRKSEAQRDQTVAGGKYPHLCRFAEHLLAGLGSSLRVISVERPLEQSIRSLQTRSKKHPDEWFSCPEVQGEQLQRSLFEHRERFLNSHPEVPRHRIVFDELLTHPEREINRLIEFLGIEPTVDERQAAIAHVDPNLKHHA